MIKLHLNQDMVHNILDTPPMLPFSYPKRTRACPSSSEFHCPQSRPWIHWISLANMAAFKWGSGTAMVVNLIMWRGCKREKGRPCRFPQDSGCFLSKASGLWSLQGRNANKHLKGFQKPHHLLWTPGWWWNQQCRKVGLSWEQSLEYNSCLGFVCDRVSVVSG